MSLAPQAAGQLLTAVDALMSSGVTFDQMARDRVEYVDFYSYFKKAIDDMFQRQIDYWKALFQKWLRHELFYDGHQALVPRMGGGFDVRHMREKHRVYVINRLQPYSDEQTSAWMAISPKIGVNLLTDDQETIQRKLDAFKNLSEHYDYLHHTPHFLQRIAKHAQFCGPYIAEVWFDKDNLKGQELKKYYQSVSAPPSQLGTCVNCGANTPFPMDAATPACGQCQSPYLNMTPLQGYDFQIPAGEGWDGAGEVELVFRPTWSGRYSLGVGPERSPWYYDEEDQVRETVEYEYGRLEGTAGDNWWARDEIMHPGRILRRAERDRGVSVDFESDNECVLIQRFYFEKEMLHYVALNQPTKLPSGEVIPARVRLSQVFQDGFCIKATPGAPYFLDVYRESHHDRFRHGQYNVSAGKAIPRGNDEAPNYNKFLNVLMSGAFDHTLKTLAPSLAIVEELFPDGRIWNREDRTIKVKLAQLIAAGGALEKGVLPIVPPQLSPASQALIESFSGELRRATKSESYLNSEDAGVDPDTATAARIGESRNARANSLQLSSFAYFLKDCRERVIKLAQEHYGETRLASIYDEEERDRIAVVVKKTDFDVEFTLWVERGSWMPDLDVEKRQSYTEAMEALQAGQQAGLPMQPLIKSINRIYNVDIASDRQLKRIRSCEETLDKLYENLNSVRGAYSLYSLAPVNPYETNHEACYLWWREWLTWKGRNAHPLLKQVAIIYIQVHAAAWLGERDFVSMAAKIGQGLIAAPIQAGIAAEQQQAPRLLAPPPGVVPGQQPNQADAGGQDPAGASDFQTSNLTM